MLSRVRLSMGGLLVAAAVVVGPVASAATVDLQFDRFSRRNLAAAQDAQADFLAGHAISNLRAETFEGYKAWNGKRGKANPQNTTVGSFTAFGAARLRPLRGQHRQEEPGAQATTHALGPLRRRAGAGTGGKWLDSNDNIGISWQIGGVGKFNALAFFVTRRGRRGRQVLDQGRRHALLRPRRRRRQAHERQHPLRAHPARRGGGEPHGGAQHDRINDGFGIDGVTVGRQSRRCRCPRRPRCCCGGSRRSQAFAGAAPPPDRLRFRRRRGPRPRRLRVRPSRATGTQPRASG